MATSCSLIFNELDNLESDHTFDKRTNKHIFHVKLFIVDLLTDFITDDVLSSSLYAI